jgi:predicted Ser/Thr protein kinase
MTTPTKDTLIQKLQGYGLSQVVAQIDPLSIEDLIAFVEKDWIDLGCSLAVAIVIYNHLHPRPTIAQFLKNSLPLIANEKPAHLSTRSERAHPRRPKNVIAWPEFKQDAIAFQYPDSLAHTDCILPNYTGKIIKAEIPDVQGIIDAHLKNFNLIFETLGNTYRFESRRQDPTPDDVVTFTGKPDHLLCDGSNVLAFVEDKAPWYLPKGNLVQMWNEDKDLSSRINPDRDRSSVKDVIEQVYGYLSFNQLKYGILTCYDVTYFVSRPAVGTLAISEPIGFDSSQPTFLECIYYLTDLVHNANGAVEISPESDSGPSLHYSSSDHQRSSSDDGDDSDYDPQPKKRKLNIGSSRSKISKITPKNIQHRQLIGEGVSGQVFRLTNESRVIKVSDIFNNPDGYRMLLHEIEIYKHLQKFNLDFVPRYYFDEEVYGQHFLVIDFVPGKPCNWRDSEYRDSVKSCLKRLRQCGVKHLDPRPENILLAEDGKISIIDFGMSELIS